MSFGFPAYYTEEFTGSPDSAYRDIVSAAILTLGWSVCDESNKMITASTSVNLWSWGERFVVQFHSRGATVTSRCALFTQCLDWGKNKSNVRKLLAEVIKHAGP